MAAPTRALHATGTNLSGTMYLDESPISSLTV